MKPLRDMLLLTDKIPPGMIGLILVPDIGTSANKSGCFCEVLAAGPKCELVKVGDTVHVSAYGSHPASELELEYQGKKCFLIRERDVNGVVVA